jgi:hypothetical protein
VLKGIGEGVYACVWVSDRERERERERELVVEYGVQRKGKRDEEGRETEGTGAFLKYFSYDHCDELPA